MSILRLFLNSQGLAPNLVYKILGCIFLAMAGCGAIFFLFRALVPLMGYLESGALACAALAVVGGILLFIDRRNHTPTPEESAHKLMASLKDFDLETVLKNNAIPLSLLSLGVGLALSQVKNIKHLSDIYKILK